MRTLGPSAHARVMARWLAHYRQESYDRISFGALFVRRRRGGGRGVQRGSLDLHAAVPGPGAGAQVGRALANLECLGTHRDDEALLALAPAIPKGQRIEQRLRHDGERYRLRRAVVRQADGLGATVAVSTRVLELLYRLDGRRPLSDCLRDLGVGAGADGRERTAETLLAVRELLGAGLLALAQ